MIIDNKYLRKISESKKGAANGCFSTKNWSSFSKKRSSTDLSHRITVCKDAILIGAK